MNPTDSDVLLADATRQSSSTARTSLLTALASGTSLGTQLATLPAGETYRVILSSPVAGGLHLRSDGLYDAFVLGPTGKIAAVARLEKIGLNLLLPAGMLVGQALLLVVVQRLYRIERKLDEMKMILRAQQFGELQAQFRRLSTLRYQGNFKDPTLADIEGRLSSGLQGLLNELRARLMALPAPASSVLGRARDLLDRRSAQALDECEMLAGISMQALRAYAEAQMLMVPPEQAAQIIKQWVAEFINLPLDRAESLGRAFYAGPGDRRREDVWREAKLTLADTQLELERTIRGEVPLRIEVSASGQELQSLAASHPSGATTASESAGRTSPPTSL